MKSMKLISTAALALLAMSTTVPVLAAGSQSVANSTASVGILDGSDNTDPTVPYDPEDPDHPAMGDNLDPDDPGKDGNGNRGTGNAGPLSLDYVSNLNFGMNKYNGSEITYNISKLDADGNATGNPLTYNPWIQITDKRNTGTGWDVSVNYDTEANKGPFQKDDGTELKGAILTFGTASFEKKEANNYSADPTHDGQTAISSTATNIASAATDAGMGTWFEHFSKADTTLYIPAGNTAGAYKANLVWTLTDAAK